MMKLNITIESEDGTTKVTIESGPVDNASNKEYVYGKMLAEAIQGISPIIAKGAAAISDIREIKNSFRGMNEKIKQETGVGLDDAVRLAKECDTPEEFSKRMDELVKKNKPECKDNSKTKKAKPAKKG